MAADLRREQQLRLFPVPGPARAPGAQRAALRGDIAGADCDPSTNGWRGRAVACTERPPYRPARADSDGVGQHGKSARRLEMRSESTDTSTPRRSPDRAL